MHRTLAQLLQGLPLEPVSIAGISFTRPEPLASYAPHHGSGVYVWLAPQGGMFAGTRPPLVYVGTAPDLAHWDADRQGALQRWESLGRSQHELTTAVHHLPRALPAELHAIEKRLVDLLCPMLNQPQADTQPVERAFARSR